MSMFVYFQGHSEEVMLKEMVENGVTWMSNGLNINCLKIVVYRKDDKLLKVFQNLKFEYDVSNDTVMMYWKQRGKARRSGKKSSIAHYTCCTIISNYPLLYARG